MKILFSVEEEVPELSHRDSLYLTIEIYRDVFIAFDTLFLKAAQSVATQLGRSLGTLHSGSIIYITFSCHDGYPHTGYFSALQIVDRATQGDIVTITRKKFTVREMTRFC